MTILLTIWLDKIAEERLNVQKFFAKLKVFTNNIKPISKLDDSVRSSVERLIQSAFVCHLDPDRVRDR